SAARRGLHRARWCARGTAWSSASVEARTARGVEIMDIGRAVAQRQASGARRERGMQAGRDASATAVEMAVDERVAAERFNQVDLRHEQRFGFRARLEVLRANAEQHLLPAAL